MTPLQRNWSWGGSGCRWRRLGDLKISAGAGSGPLPTDWHRKHGTESALSLRAAVTNHAEMHHFLPGNSVMAPWDKVVSMWRKTDIPDWIVVAFVTHQTSIGLKTPQSDCSIFGARQQVISKGQLSRKITSSQTTLTIHSTYYMSTYFRDIFCL